VWDVLTQELLVMVSRYIDCNEPSVGGLIKNKKDARPVKYFFVVTVWNPSGLT